MRPKKPIIGLCGGIGAGKSLVAREFEHQGCLVVQDDVLNHEILRQPRVRAMLRAWWGRRVIAPDGRVERRRIAEIVFADPVKKQRLEGLVHPLIARRRAAIVETVGNHSAIKAIVIDSPLLFEANVDRECDTVVFVAARAARRRRRLAKERGWDAEELRRRERWQISPARKRRRAQFVVDNDGPAENVRPQVAEILQKILARQTNAQ